MPGEQNHRLVVPLVAAEMFGQADSDGAPHFLVDDQQVVLDPLQITNLPSHVLGAPVRSLADQDTTISTALDALVSRAWR